MYDLPIPLVVAVAETIHAPLFAQEREDCLVSYSSGTRRGCQVRYSLGPTLEREVSLRFRHLAACLNHLLVLKDKV